MFLDASRLNVFEGQYNLSNDLNLTKSGTDFLIGASTKRYILNSQGTLFADTAGNIKIDEVGAYAQLSQKLLNDVLKLSVSGRYDKNTNFDGRFTPRASAVVKLAKVEGWDSPYQPLVARFTLELPDYAVVAGKRVLLPSLLFQSQQKDAYNHVERKYPVYFPYPFSERDRVSIKLPSGYSMENIPPRQDLSLDFARYQTAAAYDGKQFIAERAFGFNAVFVQLARYPELKDFMSKVKAGDEQQAVLKMGVTTNAEKTN